jgi:hypothetical protein
MHGPLNISFALYIFTALCNVIPLPGYLSFPSWISDCFSLSLCRCAKMIWDHTEVEDNFDLRRYRVQKKLCWVANILGHRLRNIRVNTFLWTLPCPYPYSDVIILLKNPSNSLMYVNTILFTLLHCYMFQPSRGLPWGVPIRFVSSVNSVRVQMSTSGSQIYMFRLSRDIP